MVHRGEAKKQKEYMAIRKFLLWNTIWKSSFDAQSGSSSSGSLAFFSVKSVFEHSWGAIIKQIQSLYGSTLFINASSWKTLFLTLLASSSLQQTFLELNLQMTKTEQNWRSLRPSRGWLRQRREEKFAKKHVMQSLFCTTKTMNTIYVPYIQKQFFSLSFSLKPT